MTIEWIGQQNTRVCACTAYIMFYECVCVCLMLYVYIKSALPTGFDVVSSLSLAQSIPCEHLCRCDVIGND